MSFQRKNAAILATASFRRLLAPVLDLPRNVKRLVAVSADIFLCVFATWLAFYLRLGEFANINGYFWLVVGVSVALAVPILSVGGLYQSVFRFAELRAFKVVARALFFYGVIYSCTLMLLRFEGVPRTVGFIQPLLLFVGIVVSRLIVIYSFGEGKNRTSAVVERPNVIIYGAGSAGRQLAMALNNTAEMCVVGFVDDDRNLAGSLISGLPIYSPKDLPRLVSFDDISHVLLAMTSISRSRRNEILNHVAQCGVAVRTLPSMVDLAKGTIDISDLKELDIDDLLGRPARSVRSNLLSEKVTKKKVLVTGAGGSIGGELCCQILRLEPKTLILVENSEFNLYNLLDQLEDIQSKLYTSGRVTVIPLLCSVQDRDRISKIMMTWHPDIVYHAAAYKHVPIVEQNVVEGFKNNVFGTLAVVDAAIAANVSDFVLVSTDKAVRPTNVMGATKRLAEMILQARQSAVGPQICLSMVRFGNVIASSGSVIPKFRYQLKNGGPLTVTHQDVTRYFMTIPEAAQLVIQAAALARGGDVFVLDMGRPINILNLARKMIRLSGLSEKTEENPNGDVEISIIGLRPGEKMYEELLIGDNPEATAHPDILRANEQFVPWEALSSHLRLIDDYLRDEDVKGLRSILEELIDGFANDQMSVDKACVESVITDR